MTPFTILENHPLPLEKHLVEALQDRHCQFSPEDDGYLSVDELHSEYQHVLAETHNWRAFKIPIVGCEGLYLWNHYAGYGLRIQGEENYTETELAKLLAGYSDEIPITIDELDNTIRFAEKHKTPILNGEKTATLRLGYPTIAAGDSLTLTSEGRDEWATATCESTFTSRADAAAEYLERQDAHHSAVRTDKPVSEILAPYYDQPVTPQNYCQRHRIHRRRNKITSSHDSLHVSQLLEVQARGSPPRS
ncbi:hypothetical protein [Haloarcula sp. 1CSR25-25]|jgi:hypothetical protein|uniref:hypothetical protein n=1 Tax=Haloarcula sp. 1CSR25-25 TaxID=2862545 RepID=UPI002895729B|nr:hypothetical protein [Haloarcula sp. 1CSR25-25]MDT3437845.1 hypothetical protein [Haloarcula sp. 1CSR25-25]